MSAARATGVRAEGQGSLPTPNAVSQAGPPRVMIAAPHGRSGKTVLTLGLLRALRKQGAAVQPFKKGPDYIDPGWHTVAAGRVSRNLDRYFMSPDQIRQVVVESAPGADLCIIEAAMGLYDGLDVEGSTSSAEIAKAVAAPVILVVDVTRMTRTCAALVLGCCAFDPEVQIAGVILNRVRGERQHNLIAEALQRYCGIPVVGSVPSDARLAVPDRHLGLVTSDESRDREALLDGIAAVVQRHVDLDAIKDIASRAKPLATPDRGGKAPTAAHTRVGESATIAVMRDQAFSFYYPENLIALEQAGATLAFVHSLEDGALPPHIDGLYLGGGFPEEYAAGLQDNESLRRSVRAHIERGLPVYAECGGLMYLGRTLTYRETTYEMVGALGFDTVMGDHQHAHGYACAIVKGSDSWLPPQAVLKGHEHHHSQVMNLDPTLPFACKNERGRGIAQGFDDLCYKGVVAGYLHVNALASPAWAPAFVCAAQRYRARRLRSFRSFCMER